MNSLFLMARRSRAFLPALAAGAVVMCCLEPRSDAAAGAVFGDFDLAGTDHKVQWTNLSGLAVQSGGNPSRTPDFGTGTITPLSPGYQASAGFYSFSNHYAFTVSKTDFTLGMDIKNVLLQIDWSPNDNGGEWAIPYEGGPTLSWNGGSQNLLFNFSAITGLEEDRPTSFGPGDFYGWAFQWDLSAIPDEITSITIHTPVSVHTSVMAAQLNASETFAQAVPEPTTTALLAGAGVMALVRRRRRKSH